MPDVIADPRIVSGDVPYDVVGPELANDVDIAVGHGSEQVQTLFTEEIRVVNEGLARYEQIRIWEVLPADFTIETGELTPTQKIKRRVINEKYSGVIDQLYQGDAPA